jgi:hypothetical protein
MSDRMTTRFIGRELPASTLGEILERYREIPHRELWTVEHLWYLVGCGDVSVSSSPEEVSGVLYARRCERVERRRAGRVR